MRRILSFIILIIGCNVFAQNIALYQAFLGKYDFTMIGNTMNELPNGAGTYCDILTSSSATLNLQADQQVEAAFLYWAGSGSLNQADLDIKLNGTPITAERTFTTLIADRGIFGAFADVTALVQAIGNGNYTVSDFDLSAVISPYCGNGTNFGGWSILIVYKQDSLTNNLVNVYDGFVKVDQQHTTETITLSNLNVLHVVGNKIGFLAWEGDDNIAVSEQLRINGNLVSNPPLNPANNVFNGTNSFTNSNTLYNMDMDYFDINTFTNIGDNNLVVSLQSGQDGVIINNMVVVLNSEVPDATVEFEPILLTCDTRDLEINYRVNNTIATDILPAGTPIAFYADNILIGNSATLNDIPIGGFEDNTITITVPMNVPNAFTLRVVVDDDGNGNSTVIEFQEDNNEFTQNILLGVTPTINAFDNLTQCDTENSGSVTFDLTTVGNQMLGTQNNVLIRYYLNQNDAEDGNANNINTPNAFVSNQTNQTIWVRLEDPMGCFVVTSFTIQMLQAGMIAHPIDSIQRCSIGQQTIGVPTDLTENLNSVLNGANPNDFTITYHFSQNDAMSGANQIPDPQNFTNTVSPQTIWVRLESFDGCVQYGSFELIYHLNPLLVPNVSVEECRLGGIATFDLSQINPLVINNTNGLIFTYHNTQVDAQHGVNPLPTNYTPASTNETIWVRVENANGCVSEVAVNLLTIINTATLPNVLQVCDDPYFVNDERAEFDLTTYQNQVIAALAIPNAELTYYTSMNEAEFGLNPIPNPTQFTNTENPQIIYVRAENPNGGCGGVAQFTIEVLPVPELELPEYVAFCRDEIIKSYTVSPNNAIQSYTWINSDGETIGTTSEIIFDEPGVYTLIFEDGVNQCEGRRDIEVIFDQAPTITKIDVQGTNVSVYATGGSSPYTYTYNNGLTWNNYFQFQEVEPGVYDMLVKSKYGCVSTPYKFGVLGIPNVITPNGDGFNDYLTIRGLEMYPDSHIQIFDRYGKIFVDRKMDAYFKWDGKYQGRPLPTGDYWYIITTTNDLKFSGHITIRNRS